MSPGVPHIRYTYLNYLDSPELVQSLVTLTADKALTAKLRRQGYRYFIFRKVFSKFYRRQGLGRKIERQSEKHFCTRVYRNQNFKVS